MPPSTSTAAQAWSDARIARMVSAFDVEPTVDRTFSAVNGSDAHGSLRVFSGDVTIVDSRLSVPRMSIDSVMLHAFAPSASTSPHLVSDLAVMPDGRWHFHVDLLPRVDAVTSTDYIDHVYPALTDTCERAYAIPGSRRMPVPLRLRALSSAWLVGIITAPEDEPTLTDIHDTYTARWASLVDEPPVVPGGPSAAELVERDARHRTELFSDRTDPVWGVVASIVGSDAADQLISSVRG